MCRWFAYVSPTEHCLLEDVLISPEHALSKQVHDHYLPKLFSHEPDAQTTIAEVSARNRLFNVDGFGVLWYTGAGHFFNGIQGKRPAVYKSTAPPTNDANFHSICANVATTACFGHIRASTSATGVNSVNCHPFTFGRHAIMHNGIVTDFLAIKRELVQVVERDAFENIHGSTDSEHLAALYMTALTRNAVTRGAMKGRESWELDYPVEEMAAALLEAVTIVIGLQQKILGSDKAEANSLNVAVTDGLQLVAFRYRNHKTEQPPSLYWSDTAGVTMNRKYPDHADGAGNPIASKQPNEHAKHCIVASEPTTYKMQEWNLIPKNCCLMVSKDGTASVESINVPVEMIATAITTQHA